MVREPETTQTGETIWYEDPIRKGIHSTLVRAGMERARRDGNRIGRPKLSDEPGFEENFKEVTRPTNMYELLC